MSARIVIEEPCKHGIMSSHLLSSEEWEEIPPKVRHCRGGFRRVLDPGSYVLIERNNRDATWSISIDLDLYGFDGAPVNVNELFDHIAARNE